MDKGAKLMEIFGNEQFKVAVANVVTPEDMQKLIAEHGLDLTVDEVIDLCGQIANAMNSDEIGEEELDNVAGGVVILGVTFTVAQLVWLGIGSAGAAALGIWNGYNKTRKKK